MGAQMGSKGAMSEINMTPLIDIVLVVLIIMMVNIPIQVEEMGLKLPSSLTPPTPPAPEAEQLVISIYAPESEGAEPTLALNRRVMKEQSMRWEVQRRLRPMTNKNVFIDAHQDVPYGKVVDMVDLARAEGAVNVGLAKLKPEGPLPATSVDAGAGIPRGVHLGSPQVRGEMTEVQADAAIQPLKGAIQQCYLTRLAQRPELTGNYLLYVEVGPQGEHLKEPEVESDSVQDLDLRDCVTAVLPNLRYKPLGEQKTAWVRYSLLFSPG